MLFISGRDVGRTCNGSVGWIQKQKPYNGFDEKRRNGKQSRDEVSAYSQRYLEALSIKREASLFINIFSP